MSLHVYQKLHLSHCVDKDATPIAGFGEASPSSVDFGHSQAEEQLQGVTSIETGMEVLSVKGDDEGSSSDGEWC